MQIIPMDWRMLETRDTQVIHFTGINWDSLTGWKGILVMDGESGQVSLLLQVLRLRLNPYSGNVSWIGTMEIEANSQLDIEEMQNFKQLFLTLLQATTLQDVGMILYSCIMTLQRNGMVRGQLQYSIPQTSQRPSRRHG